MQVQAAKIEGSIELVKKVHVSMESWHGGVVSASYTGFPKTMATVSVKAGGTYLLRRCCKAMECNRVVPICVVMQL